MYLGASKGGWWSNVDRSLAEGVLEYERSLNKHGIPWWIAQDPGQDFTPKEILDYAAARFDTHVEESAKGEGSKAGLSIAIVHTGARKGAGRESAVERGPEVKVKDEPQG